MNIFVLSKDPYWAARYHCDAHVIAMIKESYQLLSTAMRVTYGKDRIIRIGGRDKSINIFPGEKLVVSKHQNYVRQNKLLCELTHVNHPCSIWARQSKSNFEWLLQLVLELEKEWLFRYEHPSDKRHALAEWVLPNLSSDGLPDIGLTPFAQAMPDEYRNKNIVNAYRTFYIHEKYHLFGWKNRKPPKWINPY